MAISQHPSTAIEASNGEEPKEESKGERSSRESRARFEEDGPAEPSRFSLFETQLQLVQRDTVRDISDKSSEHCAFKHKQERRKRVVHLSKSSHCVDRIKSTASLKKWISHSRTDFYMHLQRQNFT